MSESPNLVWLRNDLRLRDNAALAAALNAGGPVDLLYVWDEAAYGDWVPGGAAKVWLHHALKSLEAEILKHGGRLLIRQGKTAEVLHSAIEASGAGCLFWNRRYEPKLRALDAELKLEFRAEGLEVNTFNSALLNEPHTVANKSGGPFKVYSPYFKSIQDRPVEVPVAVHLEQASWSDADLNGVALDALKLLPAQGWWRDMVKDWDISEAGAQERLDRLARVVVVEEGPEEPVFEGGQPVRALLREVLLLERLEVLAINEFREGLGRDQQIVLRQLIRVRVQKRHDSFHYPLVFC